MDIGLVHDDLAGFERCKCFTGAGGMPDVAVTAAIFDPLNQCFSGIVLVGTQHHQDFMGLILDYVFGNHSTQVIGIQKSAGEGIQGGDIAVVFISPVKCLLEGLAAVIGVIFGVDAIADNEYLDIIEEATVGPVGMALVAVDLVKSFFQFNAPALQFDLHQGQAIDQDSHIVAIFIFTGLGYLVGDLEQVIIPVIAVTKRI